MKTRAYTFVVFAITIMLTFPMTVLAENDPYTVQPGDTLSKIARKTGTTIDVVVAANKEKYPCLATKPSCLQVGWVLVAPGAGGEQTAATSSSHSYTVQSGDALATIATKTDSSVEALVAANKAQYSCLAEQPPCLQVGWVLSVPASAQAPTATPADYWNLRLAVAAEINRVRTENGLPPYAWNDQLAGLAQTRSVDMATRGYLGHYDPVTGAAPGIEMMRAARLSPSCEIIHWTANPSEQSLPAGSVSGWLNSPRGHRHCVLAQELTLAGIGVSWDSKKWIVTALVAGGQR